MGTIWETGFGVFLLVTIILGGGAAYMTGRAVALTWSTLWHLSVYLIALTGSVRFIHYALFSGTLLTLQYFLVDLVVLAVIGGIGFQVTKTAQMVGQYSWLYERRTPVSWRERPATSGSSAQGR